MPGIASFDLPVPGGSLAADLARRGHRVFIVDARGHGASDRPAALDEPPSANPPAVTGERVVSDLRSVVDRLRATTRHDRVDVVGRATGGHRAAWYASEHPDRVEHLVVYNSLYGAIDGHPVLGRGSDYEGPARPGRFDDARHGAYRLSTGPGLLGGWDQSIPVEDESEWRDPRVAAAYVEHAMASDPTSADREPPSFRARALVLLGERDFWSREGDVTTLVADLGRARDVRSVTLSGATHFAHLDRAGHGRDRWLDEVSRRLHGPVTTAARAAGPAAAATGA